MTRRAFVLLGSATLLALAGCAKDNIGKTVLVRGTVTVGEQTLPFGTIVFVPDGAGGNNSRHEPRGKIEAGKYTLFIRPGREGATPGRYKVAIFSNPDPALNNPYAEPTLAIPLRYANAGASQLTVDITEEERSYDFHLTSDE